MSVKQDISRTFYLELVTVNYVDLDTMDMSTIELAIPDKFARSDKQLENKCQTVLEKQGNFKLINIVSHKPIKRTYSMDEDRFIASAIILKENE